VTRARIEQQPDIRFGLYLRPSLAMSRAQAEIHDIVARQYGTMCAGRFMPHATIKGFFRSDASVDELVAALEPVMARHEPYEAVNRGMIPFGKSGGPVLDIHHDRDGAVNAAQQRLHEDVFTALRPLVRDDCDFTPVEGAMDTFHAHLTLAMGDIPRELLAELLAFLRDAEPIGPASFTAERFHLVAMRSRQWDGPWWETMQWTLLHSWRVGSDGESVRVTEPAWNTPMVAHQG
jgi:2'-5' RNA ligase